MTMSEGSGEDDVLDGVFDRETPKNTVETVEQDAGQARDERGRFSAKVEPQPEPQAQTEQSPPEPRSSTEDPRSGHMVPVSELTGERQKWQTRVEQLQEEANRRYQTLEQQLQSLQQVRQQPQQQTQIEPPDFNVDPEGALSFHLQRQQAAFVNQMLNQSEIMARDKFGDELVDAALKAAQAAGATNQFMDKPHPWGELVKWHKRQQTLQRVGEDPDAYEARVRKEEREKVLAELKAGGQAAAAAPKFPGSLATATGQGEQGAHLTEEAAMGSIFASGRNRKTG
jgi:hypothetical protein